LPGETIPALILRGQGGGTIVRVWEGDEVGGLPHASSCISRGRVGAAPLFRADGEVALAGPSFYLPLSALQNKAYLSVRGHG
jgi:hypothetical protein